MIDWNTTALVFPGQASQVVGMGADIATAYPETKAVFAAADEALGFALSALCWNGPEDELNQTINTQPALYAASIATLRVLENALGDLKPAYLAGHSLGEITALAAAGALSFEDGLKLVRERGRLMQEAGETNPGGMAAIIGARDVALIEQACAQASDETGEPVVLANDNCPGQVVISGKTGALDRAMELLREGGAKRVVPIAVSLAGHSPLLEDAAGKLAAYLEGVSFNAPKIPVIANVTAAPLETPGDIRAELAAQLTSRVRWTESVQAMRAAGIETFIEVGSKDVLTGLLRRIDRKATGVALNSAEAVAAFIAEHTP
jgi:[acyl-carrier-protein] S-malonyltransferase